MTEQPPSMTAARPGLSQVLARRHISMISIGGIIGAGLFVGSSAAIAAAGPAIVVSYLLAGAIVLLVMRMLGEMAVALPGVRAFTEFTRAGLGPGAGFVVGWLYWYFWIVVVPVEAIAGAALLHQWIALDETLIGIALMAIMTLVNLMSARSYGEFEFWFASIKVAAIVIFIALAAAWLLGLARTPTPALANLTSHGGFAPFGMTAVLASVTTVFFSLTGAEITTVAAAEAREPGRAIARMSGTVIVRILIFYVASVALIVCVVPWKDVIPGHSPFAQALDSMQYTWAGTAMSAIILTAVLSCLNSAFYVTSRVLFALAERGDAPQWLAQLNGRRVPARSVLMGSIAGFAGILAATLSPARAFAFLVNASGALMLFIYLLTAVAQLRLRYQREAAAHAALPLRMWWHPYGSYAAIAAMAAVLVAMALTPALRSQLAVSLLALLVALLAYLALARRRRIRALPPAQPAGGTG
ncbi:MAG: amino acid permease [Gammaproteobacteria bacterium]|nr:amino acid permease [Gammaproteobacteria bacterium]